ncbi:formyltetrahydrofolate deformylase [Chitinophaga lutea]|uniref:Formyltetrahydrofolate deformylase n=1 Tax=Chitinophaga lutea TaxID=2488634 RepID=A0A3N4Q7K1_9BACT|nr:formyltetrahydrofolate deformylase [Chitinophaga lutea]RPE13521.1 formyltetrahydrofolate deformylase [Chitinophaga lutea]
MVALIQSKDRIGLVADISGIMARAKLNIVSLREHVDKVENRFYIRIETENETEPVALEQEIRKVLPDDALIAINPRPEKKIVVMVTKEYHCLADILVRHQFKTLGATVQCVIGNHAVLQDICDRFGVPFHFVSHEGVSKDALESAIRAHIDACEPDYIVLAKFMRILSPAFVAAYPMRIINIHHSFLPAFAGAHPYRQAFERGVKLIGATSHFVTNELDEGPIIAQQVIPVNHSYTAGDMMKAGQEIETSVLARALRLVFSDRVFVYRNKTVVFE